MLIPEQQNLKAYAEAVAKLQSQLTAAQARYRDAEDQLEIQSVALAARDQRISQLDQALGIIANQKGLLPPISWAIAVAKQALTPAQEEGEATNYDKDDYDRG